MSNLNRKPSCHEISTQEDVDFLVQWIKVAMYLNPNLQGQINSISIKLTEKFVGLDQGNILSIEKNKRECI